MLARGVGTVQGTNVDHDEVPVPVSNPVAADPETAAIPRSDAAPKPHAPWGRDIHQHEDPQLLAKW